MKKFICILSMVLLVSCMMVPVYGVDVYNSNSYISKEYLEDGSYYIIEVMQHVSIARSNTISGSKRATYYGANNVAIFSIDVTGYFTYDGISAKADSASTKVYIYDAYASLISKGEYTSGGSAVGYAYIKYGPDSLYKSVILTCSKDGKLS